MPMTKKELFKENRELASLYDVCGWFIQTYPDDVFVNSEHPVHKIRDLCKEVIKIKKFGVKQKIEYDIAYLFSKKGVKMVKKKEIDLLCHFLELASDEFGNHGCNDIEEEVWKDWSLKERKTFIRDYHKWNGDLEEYEETYLHLPDFAIMSFLKYKLLFWFDEVNNDDNRNR